MSNPSGSQFPPTSWGLLEKVRQGDTWARDEFARRYDKPVLAYLNRLVDKFQIDRSEAEDLAQEFLTKAAFGGPVVATANPNKGRFRTFVKQSLSNSVIDLWRKRRPEVTTTPDSVVWERIGGTDAETAFDEAWWNSLIKEAAQMVRTDRGIKFPSSVKLFEARYLENPDAPPSWKTLGRAVGLDAETARQRANTVRARFIQNIKELLVRENGSEEAALDELSFLRSATREWKIRLGSLEQEAPKDN